MCFNFLYKSVENVSHCKEKSAEIGINVYR